MKKKRQFNCAKCGYPCEIYKKGKGHRVFICTGGCGILATNPIPLIAGAVSALAPTLIEKGSELLGMGAKSTKTPVQRIIKDDKDKPNQSERIINQELNRR